MIVGRRLVVGKSEWLGATRVLSQQVLAGWRKLRVEDGEHEWGWSYRAEGWKIETDPERWSVANWGAELMERQEEIGG